MGKEFHFSNGGRFISDESTVSNENIPRLLELITSLLKYGKSLIPRSKGEENSQYSDIYIGEYDFLPSMFLNLAYYSDTGSGYRLLNVCAWHTSGPKSTSINYQDTIYF